MFNYFVHNGDAHIKNFSLIRNEEYGDYTLTPAYDLLNTRLHVPNEERTALALFKDDFETDSYKANAFYAYDDFRELALRLGLREMRFRSLMQAFIDSESAVFSLIDRSALSEECKRLYKRHVHGLDQGTISFARRIPVEEERHPAETSRVASPPRGMASAALDLPTRARENGRSGKPPAGKPCATGDAMSISELRAESEARLGEILTLEEAAAYLRVSEDALKAMVSDDDIPAQKIGSEWRFLKRALDDWLRYGRHLSREFRRFPPPWFFEFPPMEELVMMLEKRLLIRLAASEEKGDKPGSKQAVLKHFGVFRDDEDMEKQLANLGAQREAQ